MKLLHLRNLEQYVKRLCKVGLLKYPDHYFNRSRGKACKPIRWSVIAQHEITSEIIKRIIPEEHSCSWSEMVSPGEAQEAHYFCSHSWSEAFREFMASIEQFVAERRVPIGTGFWSESRLCAVCCAHECADRRLPVIKVHSVVFSTFASFALLGHVSCSCV